MAEPGDPKTHDDHDDLIGFTSPSSLAAVGRVSEPRIVSPAPQEPVRSDEDDSDDLFDDLPYSTAHTAPSEPEPAPAPVRENTSAPDLDHSGSLFSEPEPRPEPRPEPVVAAPVYREPDPLPVAPPEPFAQAVFPAAAAASSELPEWARETVRPPKAESASFGRARRADPPQGATSLYTVYALILFAVPTMGVSAFIALFAVTGRPGPDQPLSRSHFLFQQRTLWIAAVGAVLGVVLIVVNLGVFVLFIMALWVLVRGAVGLVRLAAGKPIANPNTLLI